jgi:GDP-mannose transporter
MSAPKSPYRQLQARAKARGIPANQSASILEDLLAEESGGGEGFAGTSPSTSATATGTEKPTTIVASSNEPSTGDVIFAVVFYSLCSSSMLVVNKLAMKALPAPALVSVTQLIIASAFIGGIGLTGLAEVDGIAWAKVKPFSLFVLAFATGLYANMKALAATSVGTIIVFRACCPISVALAEFLFMGREFPAPRSLLALGIVMGGAYTYVSMDSQFQLNGIAAYFWVGVWYVLICFQMAYGKALEGNVKLSMWGRVLYTNLLSVPATIGLGLFLGDFEPDKLAVEITPEAVFWVLLSSVIGIAIGYSGWLCRSVCSATSYTLVGVINKVITIMITVTFIDQSASTESLVALMVCILGGTLYKQAPMRDAVTDAAKKAK